MSKIDMQKCLAHIERELKGLESSHHQANRTCVTQVFPILHEARNVYKLFHEDRLTQVQLDTQRIV